MGQMMDQMEEAMAVPPRGPARYSKLASLGLLMISLAPVLMLGAGLIFELDIREYVFFFVPLGIALVAAVLVRFFGTWAKIIGILAALVAAAPPVGLFWTAFGLEQPGSFFDFVPGVLVVAGAVIAIVFCITAIAASSRGHRGTKATGGERIAIRTVFVLLLVVVVVSGVLTYMGISTVSGTEPSATLSMKDLQFDPRNVEVEAGSTLLLQNNDPFFHTFTIDELGIDESLTLNDEATIDLPDKPGTYIFYCRPHTQNRKNPSQDDMAGTITIS